jgi:hypothetical protein
MSEIKKVGLTFWSALFTAGYERIKFLFAILKFSSLDSDVWLLFNKGFKV